MFRLVIISTLFAVLIGATPSAAAVYTGETAITGREAGREQQAGSLFPGIIYGDPSHLVNERTGLTTLLTAINEFFSDPGSEQRSHTVASLYGDVANQETDSSPAETDITIPVPIDGSGGRSSIPIATGADPSTILNQLFSDVLDVGESTFSQRGNRNRSGGKVFTGVSGGAGGIGTTLSIGGFLDTRAIGYQQAPTGQRWVGGTPISQEFPAFEDKKTATSSDFMSLVFKLLNPYFYGSLLLILLFSIAWSARSRFAQHYDPD